MLNQFLPTAFSWDTLLLLPVLVAIECVLSADNAVALAAIARGLSTPEMQQRGLNLGLVAAFVLRIGLILTASWVTQFWQVELAGAAYLLWLAIQYFWPTGEEADASEERHHHRFGSLWEAVPMIALTDLAFSLDSVTTALAVSQETWLVITGATIGIVALRLMTGLFTGWLKEFLYLEDAGYLAVALVGLRLLLRVFDREALLPEWAMITMIGLLFLWGFSKKIPASED